jgi:predicted glycosyltransferase
VLPKELEKYRLPTKPQEIHNVIAFSHFLFGESSTMSEEAAMLGVPSIYMYNNSTLYTNHLEKDYGLMYNFSESHEDQVKAIEKGVELLSNIELRNIWQVKRKKMLLERWDVTAYLVFFFENFPESATGKVLYKS